MTSPRTASLYPTVDSHEDGWVTQLLMLLRPEVLALQSAVAPVPMSEPEFEVWVSQIVDGLSFGFLAAKGSGDEDEDEAATAATVAAAVGPEGMGRHIALASIADMARLVATVAPISGRPLQAATLGLDVAVVLAALVDACDAMRDLGALRDDVARGVSDASQRVAQLKEPMKEIGARLALRRLANDHPLLGRPFHRIVTHAEARSVAHLARAQAQGGLDEQAAAAEFARGQVQRTAVIEAVIALACVDGRVDRMETRLVRELIEMARLDSQDARRLTQELASGEGAPIDELAAWIEDPADRCETLKMVVFAALIDDELSPQEEDFIENLAVAFEIGLDDRVRIFGEIARAVAFHPGLIDGLKPAHLLQRCRRSATRHVEQWVTRNARKIGREVVETGELLALLGRWTHADLSAEERERIREQISDLIRSVPALALFAAPGGSLLIPILAKVLPFSIAPSSFKEAEHDLAAAGTSGS